MSWESTEKQLEKGPITAFFTILLIVVIITSVVGVAGFIINPFTQAARVVEKTIDADNVIYNYEYFKKQFRAVNAIDQKIRAQQAAVTQFKEEAGPRTTWTFEDKTEYARISSIVTGLEMQRADMVADYNAKANMANRSIFMGTDCPRSL